MKSNYIFMALMLASILLGSCEKTIDIAIEGQDDLIVLNGILKAGEHPSIQLYQSKFIFDRGESLPIRDAKVTIYENGKALEPLLHGTGGLYTNEQIVIKPSHEYTIKVNHSRLQDVEATVNVPARLSEAAVQLKHDVIQVTVYGNERASSKLSLTLNDGPKPDDYYLISLSYNTKEYYKNRDEDTLISSGYDYGLETTNPTVEILYRNYKEYFGLRDDLFNGKGFTVEFSDYSDLSPKVTDNPHAYYEYRHKLKVDHFNEALYQYYISLENNRYPEAFSEPTQVYSNIENGNGILGAYTTTELAIE